MRTLLPILLCMLVAIAPPSGAAGDREVLFREEFSSLDRWTPFSFPKIASQSTYTIEHDGSAHVLRAESNASASAIVYRDAFDARAFPRVRWRWKVRNLYVKADPRSKEGDDYPIRVYILFEHDPEKAGAMERMRYGFVKAFSGEYPPQRSLSYVWSSRDDPGTFVVSPYTDRAMMVLLEKGEAKVGTWVDEEVDILADYRKAFAKEPPDRARIAIMNDSDNTGERSVSWIAFIEVSR